jgi:hypothetical protein
MKTLLGILLIVYGAIFLFATAAGVVNTQFKHSFPNYCEQPLKRWEYIVPHRELSCWLAEEVER